MCYINFVIAVYIHGEVYIDGYLLYVYSHSIVAGGFEEMS